ncbi:MAG: hypothetical protein NC400_06360 [Clostridium sp.]|nr:hypothetical protein [Clostridium sp.]
MRNPLNILAEKAYAKLKPVLFQKKNLTTVKALRLLYPQKNCEETYEKFQIRRLTIMFTLLILGIVSAALVCLCSRTEGKLADGAQLIRNEWGAGDYNVTLQAKAGEWLREIPFLVRERQFSEKEKEILFEKLRAELPKLIKKENQDLKHVTGDLNLISSANGYPFKLAWSSGNSKRIRRDGKVNRTGVGEEGERVELTVRVWDEKEERNFVYEVFLMPELLSGEEKFFRELDDELLKLDSERISESRLFLPESIDGIHLVWTEKRSGGSGFLLLLSLAGCLFVSKGMENDLVRSCKKREKQLLADYPDFVGKLRLYLSAGLTVKNAFVKMALDYKERTEEKGTCYLWEEIKIACFQLENGVPEEQVYQDFGRRCGEMRYRRLGFLLSVHLKQGNGQLLTVLSEEADSAQEDKRSLAKKAGEEAGTKLLLPMMLMLVVIMFLVLLPAYMDFGSI